MPALSSNWTSAASTHIVLVGAGHAHVEVLRSFGLRPQPGVRLTLIERSANAVYSGMTPGFVAGHFACEEIEIPVAPLACFAGCTHVIGEAIGFDPARLSIRLSDGREIVGDIVSLDIGAATDLSGAADLGALPIPAKPVEGFTRDWESLRQRLESDPGLRVAVVGAGAAAVELALAIQHRLVRSGDAMTLVVDSAGLMPSFPLGVRRRVARILHERRLAIVSDAEFRAAMRGPSMPARYHSVIWATGVVPVPWLRACGLAVDERGFVAVDPRLRSISHANVFAVGDAAGMVASPRPKAGVMAVRQGPILTDNLRCAALGEPLRSFEPQENWLSLISTGDRYAIAARGNWSAEGAWVWWWKRWIDRRFIKRYAVQQGAHPSKMREYQALE